MKEQPDIIAPITRIQRLIQNRTFGEKYWKNLILWREKSYAIDEGVDDILMVEGSRR